MRSAPRSQKKRGGAASTGDFVSESRDALQLELELIQPHMAQKPVLRGEVGCACVARFPFPRRGPLRLGFFAPPWGPSITIEPEKWSTTQPTPRAPWQSRKPLPGGRLFGKKRPWGRVGLKAPWQGRPISGRLGQCALAEAALGPRAPSSKTALGRLGTG